MMTDAGSVDGEWNSGRMLPELTANGAGALTSSKYFGKHGIDALRAILEHADHYGLKWVLVRDHYYDPLLSSLDGGPWTILRTKRSSLGQGWHPPATPLNAPQIPPHWQGLMWGILPFGSSIFPAGAADPGKKTVESRVYSYPEEKNARRGGWLREQRTPSCGFTCGCNNCFGSHWHLVAFRFCRSIFSEKYFSGSTSTPESAVQGLGEEIRAKAWERT